MKKVYEIALHVVRFRSILPPPTRTHIMTLDNNQQRNQTMTLNEAKAAYIKAKAAYTEIIKSYDRKKPGARQARFAAYDDLKAAEIDLADVSVEKIETETGKNLSAQLTAIIGNASARSECAEKVFMNLA